MGRPAVACAAALAVAFASVADNAACCPEDGQAATLPGAPSSPSSACAEMPCHTPGLLTVIVWPRPVVAPRYAPDPSTPEPMSAEAPTPPTPPPTART